MASVPVGWACWGAFDGKRGADIGTVLNVKIRRCGVRRQRSAAC